MKVVASRSPQVRVAIPPEYSLHNMPQSCAKLFLQSMQEYSSGVLSSLLPAYPVSCMLALQCLLLFQLRLCHWSSSSHPRPCYCLRKGHLRLKVCVYLVPRRHGGMRWRNICGLSMLRIGMCYVRIERGGLICVQ